MQNIPGTRIAVEHADRARPTALVIEDDAEIVEQLVIIFGYHGFELLRAPDGARGLQLFRERSPSVLVTDIMRPELDGIYAILRMRRERPDIKIIGLSGDARTHILDHTRVTEKIGPNTGYPKGLCNEELVRTLSMLLIAAI